MNKNEVLFQHSIARLLAGDFSHLAPLFANDALDAGQRCAIIDWVEQAYSSVATRRGDNRIATVG